MDRHRIEVVQLLAAALDGRDQIRLLQDGEVLADRLPRHGEARAELTQGLAVFRTEPVKQFPATGIRECPERRIHGVGLHGRLYATFWLPVMAPQGGTRVPIPAFTALWDGPRNVSLVRKATPDRARRAAST